VYNKLPSDVIKIGQKLRVPVTGAVPKRKKESYEVEGGDSLRSIAEQHQIGTHVLRWLNPGVDWKDLKESQKITVFVDEVEPAPVKPAPTADKKAAETPSKGAPTKASAPAPAPPATPAAKPAGKKLLEEGGEEPPDDIDQDEDEE
jgi:LysM repeat protein